MDLTALDPIPKKESKIKKRLLLVLIVVVFLIAAFFVILIVNSEKTTQTISNNQNVQKEVVFDEIKGFSFSPRSTDVVGLLDFYGKVKNQNVTWAGDWQELADKKFPYSFTENSEKYSFNPVVIVGLYNQGEKKLIKPLTQSTLDSYKVSAVNFAEKYQPIFFGMGVEVDIMFENHPAEFEKFVTLFNETAKAIKTKSPNTQIFTAFQLERIRGLRGGLYGGINDVSNNNWSLLEKFPEADIIAFTTYPHLIYKNPSEIPSNYYDEISKKTTKPLAFIETGWPSVNIATGWESNETEQEQFVDLFAEQLKPLNKKLVIWPFLYDNDVLGTAFKGLGLITKDGSEKPSFKKWQDLTF